MRDTVKPLRQKTSNTWEFIVNIFFLFFWNLCSVVLYFWYRQVFTLKLVRNQTATEHKLIWDQKKRWYPLKRQILKKISTYMSVHEEATGASLTLDFTTCPDGCWLDEPLVWRIIFTPLALQCNPVLPLIALCQDIPRWGTYSTSFYFFLWLQRSHCSDWSLEFSRLWHISDGWMIHVKWTRAMHSLTSVMERCLKHKPSVFIS